MSIGEKISKLRKEKKLSQESLANMLNCSRQTISNWELDETSPSLKEAKELSKIFEVSLDDLVGNSLDLTTKKLNNVEKLSLMTIRLIKVLIVILGIVLIGFIVWFIITFSEHVNKLYSTEYAILNCNKDNNEERYMIFYNKDDNTILQLVGDKFINEYYFNYYYINIYGTRVKVEETGKAKNLINDIKNAYNNSSGSCNIDYYSSFTQKKIK